MIVKAENLWGAGPEIAFRGLSTSANHGAFQLGAPGGGGGGHVIYIRKVLEKGYSLAQVQGLKSAKWTKFGLNTENKPPAPVFLGPGVHF